MPLNRSALDRRKENGGSIRRRRIEFNNALNPTVLRVTALANRSKRRAARPAGYRERWADYRE